MRLQIVSDSPSLQTGYGVIAHGFGKYMARRGHAVSFIAFTHGGAPLYVDLEEETRNPSRYAPVYEGSTTASIERACEEWKPDLWVHVRDLFAFDPKFFQHAYTLAGLRKRPKVIINWAPVQNERYPKSAVDAGIRESSLILTATEWGREQLTFQGVPSNLTEVLHWGYDPEVFFPVDSKKADFGFPEGKPLLMSIGVNDQQRDEWPILLKAVSIAKRKVDVEVYLHTAPEGAFGLTYHQAIVGLKGQVGYPAGYSKTWGMSAWKLNELYNCADVYCSASSEEGFGLPVLEAMACGRKLALSEIPPYKEIAGEYAWFAPAQKTKPTAWEFAWLADPEALAGCIVGAIEGEADPGQVKAAREFGWDVIAEDFEKIIGRHPELGFI